VFFAGINAHTGVIVVIKRMVEAERESEPEVSTASFVAFVQFFKPLTTSSEHGFEVHSAG
jgi:hypothetical protein